MISRAYRVAFGYFFYPKPRPLLRTCKYRRKRVLMNRCKLRKAWLALVEAAFLPHRLEQGWKDKGSCRFHQFRLAERRQAFHSVSTQCFCNANGHDLSRGE